MQRAWKYRTKCCIQISVIQRSTINKQTEKYGSNVDFSFFNIYNLNSLNKGFLVFKYFNNLYSMFSLLQTTFRTEWFEVERFCSTSMHTYYILYHSHAWGSEDDRVLNAQHLGCSWWSKYKNNSTYLVMWSRHLWAWMRQGQIFYYIYCISP